MAGLDPGSGADAVAVVPPVLGALVVVGPVVLPPSRVIVGSHPDVVLGEGEVDLASTVVETSDRAGRDQPPTAGRPGPEIDDDVRAGVIARGVVDRADAPVRRLDVVPDQVTVQRPGRLAVVPQVPEPAGTNAGWLVDDVNASVRALVVAGITFERFPGMDQDADGVWKPSPEGGGVAWFRDPDGNRLSLSQNA